MGHVVYLATCSLGHVFTWPRLHLATCLLGHMFIWPRAYLVPSAFLFAKMATYERDAAIIRYEAGRKDGRIQDLMAEYEKVIVSDDFD